MILTILKKFNTEHGYDDANQLLKLVGELLGNDKRVTDETFRYFLKGDEFLVVAANTSLSQAVQAADRKRNLIGNHLFSIGQTNHQLTVCCGVTELKKDDDSTHLTKRVIDALSVAKSTSGKNATKSLS